MAAITPAGDHENLYASGVVEAHSGDGSPPQLDWNISTLPPSACARWMSSTADLRGKREVVSPCQVLQALSGAWRYM